jgi:hypothetical protein
MKGVAMNSDANPAGAVFLLAMIILSIMAIVGAKGAKRKLLNLLIILGFVAFGLGLGAAFGAWAGNSALGGHIAAALSIPFGAVGAFGCVRRNKRRGNESEVTKQGH